MKRLFIAGNWKSNKGTAEAEEWLRKLSTLSSQFSAKEGLMIVLGVPFTLLYFLKQRVQQLSLPLELGAQDVSPFGEGAYTGEINAAQIKEFASWVIIGHSERRKHFKEDDMQLSEKVARAKEQSLSVIYCVQDEFAAIPRGVDVVAYEPIWAIGTGKPDTPDNANRVISEIKKRWQIPVIYGGSVSADNVASFVLQPSIDGVLPGGVSLDPEKFADLIHKAVSL